MSQLGDPASHVDTKIADPPQPCLKSGRSSHLCNRHRNGKANIAGKVISRSRANAKFARALWGELPEITLRGLRDLCATHDLSVAAGDVQLLEGKWYITHSGLLAMAARCRCSAITAEIDRLASDPSNNRWVFKAVVYKSRGSKGFVGFEPSNVSSLGRGAEMRVAETRAVNRALRKAYGIGICSVEELGALNLSSTSSQNYQTPPVKSPPENSSGNGQPRLKDKLCLLMRQHDLDPALVKAYAAHFCGTETLREASRELVGSFVAHLEKEARENRDALLCKLNLFSQPAEVHS